MTFSCTLFETDQVNRHQDKERRKSIKDDKEISFDTRLKASGMVIGGNICNG